MTKKSTKRLIHRARGGVRCAAVRQQCRTGLSACLDLVLVDGDDEIGSRREAAVDRTNPNAGLGRDVAHGHIDAGSKSNPRIANSLHLSRRNSNAVPHLGPHHAANTPASFRDHDRPITSRVPLSALAAQTQRLRLGLLVTSNRFRPPAMLAKIAATVDIVSGGRLAFGIGAGSRPSHPLARREYEAHGLPFHDFAYSGIAFPRPLQGDGEFERSTHAHRHVRLISWCVYPGGGFQQRP